MPRLDPSEGEHCTREKGGVPPWVSAHLYPLCAVPDSTPRHKALFGGVMLTSNGRISSQPLRILVDVQQQPAGGGVFAGLPPYRSLLLTICRDGVGPGLSCVSAVEREEP